MNCFSRLSESILATIGLAFASRMRNLRTGIVGIGGGLAAFSLVSCESLDQAMGGSPRNESIPHSEPIRVEPPAGYGASTGDRYRTAQPNFGIIRPNVVLPEEEAVGTSGRRRSTTRREGSPRSGVESVRPEERRDRTRVIRDPLLGIIPTGTVDANKPGNVTTLRR